MIMKLLSILFVLSCLLCLMGCRTVRFVPVPEYHTI